MSLFNICKRKDIFRVHFSCPKRCFGVKTDKKPKYTNTIQLPRTKFPQWINSERRVDLDENILKTCGFKELYAWQRKNLQGEEFILHDGPPYANGVPHMGHAINKILKDIINRNKVLGGTKVHYKPGWDCHGLPIEMKVLLGSEGKSMPPLDLRKKARTCAQQAISDQKAVFKHWGVMADWEKECYHTYSPSYIKNQLFQFYNLFEKGLVYRDLKPVYWSPSSKTALAEAELEYNPKYISTASTVRLKLNNIPTNLAQAGKQNVYLLIWTTTPWSLPANQAVAYNPEFDYLLVSPISSDDRYLVAKELFADVQKKMGTELSVVTSIGGKELIGATYAHPLTGKPMPVLPASHVTADLGTGLVHTAPAHGPEDFLLALENKMSINCLVDENGCYTEEAGLELQSLPVLTEGCEKVIALLGKDIVHLEKITHSYPCDWRTKQPVILCASKQWFLDTNTIKTRAVELAEKVNIMPARNMGSLISQVDRRPYWCISRQRVWGVPIPVLYNKVSGEPILTRELLHHYVNLIDTKGPDFWWTAPLSEILPKALCDKLNLSLDEVQQGEDILDIWFDSGLSWSAILEDRVADLYVEGIDQFSGWFQSSLLTSTALKDRSPYKAILVHGFAVDDQGRKMSKSVGNVVDPQEIVRGSYDKKKQPAYGVDTLRWWVAAHASQHTNVPVSVTTLVNSLESIQKLRNTLRFMLGSISDFPLNETPQLCIVDHYILHKLVHFQNEVIQLYDTYQFNKVCSAITNFIVNDISGFYCHIIKDRLYCDEPDSERRRAVQFTFLHLLEVISCSFAPVLPVLTEEMNRYHPHNTDKTPFFHKKHKRLDISGLKEEGEVYPAVEKALEVKALIVKESPLNCNSWQLACVIHCSPDVFQTLKLLQGEDTSNMSDLTEILQLSSVTLSKNEKENGFSVDVQVAEGLLCDRCRKYTSREQGQTCDRCQQVLSSLGC